MFRKRKRFIQIAIICLVYMIAVIGGVTQVVYAREDADWSVQADLYGRMDDYLQVCVENAHIPAMSVSIVNQDETLFSGNYGQCHSSDTPFWLGSVSKSFTAVCIMQLAEQQKIDLNATLSSYLPDATDGNRITVSQLLNHTSGLGEHQTMKNYKVINKQDVHHYANVNYSLLGAVIETVSGQAYPEYISQHLFQPLGLSHTAATFDESIQNGVIDGYTDYWGIPLRTAHAYPSSPNAWVTVPAGYLSASSNDLGKYLRMYLNGGNGIISPESIETMFYGNAVYVEEEVPFWYGYGWATVREPFAEPVLRHSGLVENSTSCIFILPESNLAVAIETNVNDYFVSNEMLDDIGWGIVRMLLGEAPIEIADHAYLFNHLRINLIMLAVLLTAILPCCFPYHAVSKTGKRKKVFAIILLLLIHLLLPVLILLIVPIFFATPLWVARGFVPDVFLTVVVSSALLLSGGMWKGILLYRYSRHHRSE